ncbi:hypothetical protein DFH09DRAFT_896160 [Mycena vulgaris]|nr:hypothetical protein DFH09DRAFT_896160 [Mycena vulgaris]
MVDTDAPPPPPRTLSARQERRLIAFLDERFLALMRGFKMRSQAQPEPASPPTANPTSALALGTLPAFLAAATPLLALVLQIPPGPLRTAYLLRLTHDVLGGVPGYAAPAEGIALLLDWLDDLDQGWVCALQRRAWDPVRGAGAVAAAAAGAVGQTERTRLRGLLLGGAAGLEEWLAQTGAGGAGIIPEEDEEDEEEDGGEEREKGEDVAGLLARLGLQDGFDVLFAGTLEELGELGGVGVIPPA